MKDTNGINKESKIPYIIRRTDAKIVCWSSRRLPFQPVGWLKKMRDELKQSLRDHHDYSGMFYASFTSIDNNHFDLENVLFYNVGISAFTHMSIRRLVFEKILESPISIAGIQYPYFHRYISNKIDKTNWLSAEVSAIWENACCPRLTSEIKPHWIWYWMKQAHIEVRDNLESLDLLGLSLKLKIPVGVSCSLISVIKPLLDGIISALHVHNGDHLTEVVQRLSAKMDVNSQELESFVFGN